MKILVVDDEQLLVKGMKFNLENEGYTVETAYDGATAIDMAKSGGFDLIILDLMMPQVDGLTACMRIREFSNVPIIMLTARSEDADKIIGLESGADDYITKPFNILELKARIRALLRRANVKTAVLLYLVTSVLGLLLTPRKLIAAAYVLLFGLYPIVKYLIECRLPVFTQLSGKLAYFNIVLVLAAVLVSCGLFPQVQMPGIFRLAGLWIAANIGFIVYDIGLSKVIALLRRTLPPE